MIYIFLSETTRCVRSANAPTIPRWPDPSKRFKSDLKFQQNHEKTNLKMPIATSALHATGIHNSKPKGQQASAERLILFCIGCRRPNHKCSIRIYRFILRTIFFSLGTVREYMDVSIGSVYTQLLEPKFGTGRNSPAAECMQGPVCVSEL